MIDQDVSGLQQSLNAWLPSRVSEQITPVIDKSEVTNEMINKSIKTQIQNKLNESLVANAALDSKIGNAINESIVKVEGSNQALEQNLLDRIDLKMIPIETNIALSGQTPYTPIPSPTALGITAPSAFVAANVAPPTSQERYQQLQNEPIPPLANQPPQQIQNVPEPPPIGIPECPPIPPCPPQPCPEPLPACFSIWLRKCKIDGQNCVYITTCDSLPLSPDDVLVEQFEQPAKALADAFDGFTEFCNQVPICQGPAGQQIQNIPIIPGKPGCCPPAQIQNIINPPGGGQIQNIQPPSGGGMIVNIMPNPIVNEPLPTSPGFPPTTFGRVMNDILVVLKDKLKWRPTGDFAYFTDQDNDESGVKKLWSEIGIDFSSELQGKSVAQWAQEGIDNNLASAKIGQG